MDGIRIQKLISTAGICSRRQAELLIIEGRIKINGKTAVIGDKASPEIDQISLDNKPIRKKELTKVFFINKPIGFISTCHDPQGRPTVLSLLPEELRQGIHPVGRLDINSRGALLLTNNGEFTLRLTHPKFLHKKTYLVRVKGSITDKALFNWREGVLLDGQLTLKAKVDVLNRSAKESFLKVVLKEGRKRQIRRVANLLGHPVIDLQRIGISNLKLNGLPEGNWRELDEQEWKSIIALPKEKALI